MKFIDRTGEKHTNRQGYEVEIIECYGSEKCTIRFNDDKLNPVLKNKSYASIIKGIIDNPKHHVGEKYITKEKYGITIIDCFSYRNNTIQFECGLILYKIGYDRIIKGAIKNPHHPRICGIGYIGVGKYLSNTTEYYRWKHMIRRCYLKPKIQNKDVIVCEEWHNFQNYAKWFYENWKPYMNNTWDVDKDIICPKCRLYSPKTCCIVPEEINILFTKSYRNTKLPKGVTKEGKRFIA